jgi:hypothetical protein
MSLSIYDPNKGCFVLNPKKFKPVINAFHPDYVKTYMPQFVTSIRTASMQQESGRNVAKYLDNRRKDDPAHGTMFGLSKDKDVSIDPKELMLPPKPAHMHRPTRSQLMSSIVAKKRKENKNYGTALKDSPNIPPIKPKEL